MHRPVLLAALILPIAACDRSNKGASVTINAADSVTNSDAGEMKIDVPGFQGSIKLPKIKIDAGDFDLNGVKLYPGSKIESVNLAGDAGKRGGVRVRFTSPAAPETVRDWFLERLGKVGYRVHADGANLVGATDKGKPFRLDLKPNGADRANGMVLIDE